MKIVYTGLILAAVGSLALTASAQSVTDPRLSGLTTAPNPPIGGRPFTFTIRGSDFDPASTAVQFSGPGCTTPCTAKGLTVSPGEASGAMVLANGIFTVSIAKSANSNESNTLSLTIAAAGDAAPQLSTILATPDPPAASQPFAFKLKGNGFNAGTAIVDFSGPGCETPCRTGGLKGSAELLDGAAVLSGGTYLVTVRNGMHAIERCFLDDCRQDGWNTYSGQGQHLAESAGQRATVCVHDGRQRV
jgi:hypothetical protein